MNMSQPGVGKSSLRQNARARAWFHCSRLKQCRNELNDFMNIPNTCSERKRGQSGSAVVVLLAMLTMMLIFVAANTVAIRSLQRELKLIEKKQVQRLQTAPPVKPGS